MAEVLRHRRLLASGAVLAASALVLAACGDGDNGGSSEDILEERGVSGDLEEVYDTNPVDRDDLTDGGQVTLPVGSFPSQWNNFSQEGNEADAGFMLGSINIAGCFQSDPEGEVFEREEYCLSVTEEIQEAEGDDEFDTQIIHYELNPDAVWNDGTPIDFYTYEHTLNIRSGDADDDFPEGENFDLVSTTAYDQVESIEMGDDEWSFTITMAEPYQPMDSLFGGGLIHPDVDTPEIFNEGYINDVRNEWRSGPFAVDILDRAAGVLSVVPNEMWWGEEPVLDRVNFMQYEASASIQAFQNGEIDRVGVSSSERLEEMNAWQEPGDEWEIRRGQRMFRGGYVLNADAPGVSDVAVREAIFTAIDREQLNEIRFQGLNWDEEPPGGWMMMSFSDLYEDAYPVPEEDRGDPEAAAAVLEEAGYTRDSEDDYFVDPDTGEELQVNLDNFGDDTTGNAVAQSFITMVRNAGINMELNNRPSAEFGEAVGAGDFTIGAFGYTASPDPTAFVRQILHSESAGNNTGTGDEDLDELIEQVPLEPDFEERVRMAQEIEQEHFQRHFTYLGTQNGPEIFAVRSGLANHGPRLFESEDWINMGWEADADEDGTDTGVDPDELEDTDPDEDIPEDDDEGDDESEEE